MTVALSVSSMIAMCIWASVYSEQKENKWNQYYYGRQGEIGQMTIALAILPILTLVFLALGCFLMLCCCGSCCCKVLAWIIGMIGIVLYIALLICEGLTLNWDKYGKADPVYNYERYCYDNDTDFTDYVKAAEKSQYKYSTPTQGYFTKDAGTYDDKKVPVCYYSSEADMKGYTGGTCIGRWNDKRLRKYHEWQDEQTNKSKEEWAKGEESFGKWVMSEAMTQAIYNNDTLYFMVSFMLGLNLAACVCGILWMFFKCFCSKKKKDDNQA